MPHFRRNQILTALIVLWGAALLTWIVWITFTNPPDIPGPTATLVGSIFGGFGAGLLALWKWRGDKIKGPGQ